LNNVPNYSRSFKDSPTGATLDVDGAADKYKDDDVGFGVKHNTGGADGDGVR
jgi:hypothetical protein